jgi:hypothetical protein
MCYPACVAPLWPGERSPCQTYRTSIGLIDGIHLPCQTAHECVANTEQFIEAGAC